MADQEQEQLKTPLELAEERRAARKAEAQKAHDERKAVDLDAVSALEIEHGDSNVAVIHVPPTGELPTLVACRCPKPAEIKRYRTQIVPKHEKDRPDVFAATELLARACLIYPDKDVFEKLCDARPGLCAQLGKEAAKLATGKEESEGKG